MSDELQQQGESWTATLVPERKRKAKRRTSKTKGKGSTPPIPRFHVVLWDSDEHTYEYVQKMLMELFGHSSEECFQIAKTVDSEGRAIVLTTTKEHAELKRDQILAYGKDHAMRGCKGSMHATIESAD
jgi:ATP-dependent Clp protease adaptor protein ClpS